MIKLILGCFFIVFMVSPLFGQDGTRTFRILTYYEGPRPEVLYKTLEASLSRSIDRLILVPIEDGKPDLSPSALKNRAQRKSCDGTMIVNLSEEGKKWNIRVQFFVPGEETPRYDKTFERDAVEYSELAEIFWLFLVGELDGFLKKSELTIPKPLEALTSHVVVKAIAGTQIRGLTKEPLVVPQTGEISADVNYPGSYFVEPSHPTYRSESVKLFLLESEKTLEIKQSPEKVFTLEYYHYFLSFPSIDASYFFIPGQAFVRTGVTQFLAGVHFGSQEGNRDAKPLITGVPLLHLNLAAGWFFNPPQDLLRWYGALNVGVRIMVDKYVGLEPTAPLFFQPIVGIEYRPLESLAVYFETGPTIFTPLLNPKLWESTANSPGQFILATSNGIELLHLNVGLRWYVW